MLSFETAQVYAWIGAFFWPFLRILSLLMAAPLFSARQIPTRVRVAFAVVLTVALAPALPPMPPVAFDATGWLMVVQQLQIGLVMGLAVTLMLSVVQLAGSIVGLQMGLGFSTLLDPAQGTQVASLAVFLNVLALLLFTALNGHLMMLAVLARSFTLVPVGTGPLLGSGAWQMLAAQGGTLFALALAFSAPVLGTLIIANLGLAVLSKLAPQLNLFNLGFPIFFVLGLLALYFAMPSLETVVRGLVERGLDLAQAVMMAGGASEHGT
ncbi:flagellar biosynthetic protein FliR [Tibeticola sp.]|uniref:flagellar biosynthetic protein FliR n=1 Tax=Tibeticola sp. TaxID=2005368 RepID=UPI00258877BB|nr:flagellar biosynthetic protein FliR [Tibeticola sp.]MCI4439667.1 flagellar biosynthetic protein FliR [Tibeticola sp.]